MWERFARSLKSAIKNLKSTILSGAEKMKTLNIIKIGGNVIDSELKLKKFLQLFVAVPAPKILVHGGGKIASELSKKVGIEPQLVEGRRITDAETLKVVTMVYAGLVNKGIVAQLQALQENAVGICGADGNAIQAHKRTGTSTDYGFAGDIHPEQLDASFLSLLLEHNYVPVVAPITHDKKGQLLNTNADTIASSLARALSKQYNVRLIYCFEKPGVLANAQDDTSVIARINSASFQQLRQEGVISGGMIPKLDNAFEALEAGVDSVVIGEAAQLPQLTQTKHHAGTILSLN